MSLQEQLGKFDKEVQQDVEVRKFVSELILAIERDLITQEGARWYVKNMGVTMYRVKKYVREIPELKNFLNLIK